MKEKDSAGTDEKLITQKNCQSMNLMPSTTKEKNGVLKIGFENSEMQQNSMQYSFAVVVTEDSLKQMLKL